MKVESFPSTLHSMMRLFGWSTKNRFPFRVARRTFGEKEIAGEFFKFRPGRNDAFSERQWCNDKTNQDKGQDQGGFHNG